MVLSSIHFSNLRLHLHDIKSVIRFYNSTVESSSKQILGAPSTSVETWLLELVMTGIAWLAFNPKMTTF
jgi:hypothetical protein